MVDFLLGLVADIFDVFLDLWLNKVIGKFTRKN